MIEVFFPQSLWPFHSWQWIKKQLAARGLEPVPYPGTRPPRCSKLEGVLVRTLCVKVELI